MKKTIPGIVKILWKTIPGIVKILSKILATDMSLQTVPMKVPFTLIGKQSVVIRWAPKASQYGSVSIALCADTSSDPMES